MNFEIYSEEYNGILTEIKIQSKEQTFHVNNNHKYSRWLQFPVEYTIELIYACSTAEWYSGFLSEDRQWFPVKPDWTKLEDSLTGTIVKGNKRFVLHNVEFKLTSVGYDMEKMLLEGAYDVIAHMPLGRKKDV